MIIKSVFIQILFKRIYSKSIILEMKTWNIKTLQRYPIYYNTFV